MKESLTKQIQESSTRDLRTLKEKYKDTITEVVIEQEIRIRMITDTVKKLERDFIKRKNKE